MNKDIPNDFKYAILYKNNKLSFKRLTKTDLWVNREYYILSIDTYKRALDYVIQRSILTDVDIDWNNTDEQNI